MESESSNRFLVSNWEEDLEDYDVETNPHETVEKEILWAAEEGKLEKLKELLKAHPNLVHYKDKDGYTPLHRACYANHLEIVDYLLKMGADIGAKTEMLWEPLHSACQWNHKEIVVKLLQHGADVNALSQGKQTPLHIAASHGSCYDTVQVLLMHPYIKPELQNNSNETAYDIARRSSKYYNIFLMADPLIEAIP
ncbi:PREDICTED: ankyrin repeat domain-containing protein 49-like [Nicrophorus vespilloides]|uniref:Ankyrin repeat domain-containing protein 49-like n=1 Tax=Nicrophorus vespilloides TaxID=110193 RepID=A0ABM1NHF7_NICVS|nr:PREDICTED: ankyrin repeat domain-containing protein 49-like [Nicrophorus vespilloides]